MDLVTLSLAKKYTNETAHIGITVVGAIVNSSGNLVLTMSDNSKIDVGHVVGSNGASGNLAPDWTEDTVYLINQLCVHLGIVFRCTDPHTSTTAFDYTKFKATSNITASVRQTVLTGIKDSNGRASQLVAVLSSLAITELATTIPSVTTWANGFNELGAIDYAQKLTTDVVSAWSGLTANSTLYLYKERDTGTGVVSYGFTTLAPIYQNYVPTIPATNQYWFDTSAYVGYYYSGSVWVACQRVFVGECVTGAISISSVVCYAYKGQYTGIMPTIPATGVKTVLSSNLGFNSPIVDCVVECIVAQSPFAVGEQAIPLSAVTYGTFISTHSPITISNRNMISFTTGNWGGTPLLIMHESTGSSIVPTSTSWKIIINAKRRW